jgi:acetyl-CoA C-acetyltransferase
MSKINRNVAVVGTGQTKAMTRTDVNLPEMVNEACEAALEDAGIGWDEIDAVVYGSSPEFFEGFNEPEKYCADFAGAYMKPFFRIHTGGTVGASAGIGGYYHVASGMFDTVLAVTADKLTDADVQCGLTNCADPITSRKIAVGAPSAGAIQAQRYMFEFPKVKPEHAAMVVVKNRKNGMKNPYAHVVGEYTVEDVLNSPMLVSPLRFADICPTSDQAGAMVFTTKGRARELCDRPAFVRGVSTVAESINYPGRDTSVPLALMMSGRNAYKMAGIENPLEELDVAELYDAFSYQEIIWYHALGFCEPGEGWKLIENGVTEMDGKLPVNPSGGVLCANSIGATAMIRQIEAANQVMGRAGELQVGEVNNAIAHGWGGAVQFMAVMILGSQPLDLS